MHIHYQSLRYWWSHVRIVPGAPVIPTDYTNLLFYKSYNCATFVPFQCQSVLAWALVKLLMRSCTQAWLRCKNWMLRLIRPPPAPRRPTPKYMRLRLADMLARETGRWRTTEAVLRLQIKETKWKQYGCYEGTALWPWDLVVGWVLQPDGVRCLSGATCVCGETFSWPPGSSINIL